MSARAYHRPGTVGPRPRRRACVDGAVATKDLSAESSGDRTEPTQVTRSTQQTRWSSAAPSHARDTDRARLRASVLAFDTRAPATVAEPTTIAAQRAREVATFSRLRL